LDETAQGISQSKSFNGLQLGKSHCQVGNESTVQCAVVDSNIQSCCDCSFEDNTCQSSSQLFDDEEDYISSSYLAAAVEPGLFLLFVVIDVMDVMCC